jgi:N-methylhydantoinase B
MTVKKIDPIILTTIWGNMIAISEEIGITIRRSTYAETVREGDDFSVGIFDSSGELVAQGNFSPGHLGAMPFLVKHLLGFFPMEAWEPGDAVIVNDPAIGAGHLPDIYITVPVFFDGQLVTFLSAICHHIDVGGVRPGSQVIDGAVDLVAEGIRIMPTKLYRHNELNTDIHRIILDNVRDPIKTGGDLKAQRNALQHHGVHRMVELISRYGIETVKVCCKEILDRSEAEVRKEVRKVPDGRYSAENYLDGYAGGKNPIKAKVTIEVKGDEITADFTGSSPQVPAGLNSYLSYTRAYIFAAMKSLLYPKVPQNGGAVRPIKVTAPEGSFFNPRHGAPCSGRMLVSGLVYEVVMRALADALPDRVMAAYGSIQHGSYGGIDPRTGRNFVTSEILLGSHGARSRADGLDFLYGPFNAKNVPIEVWETAFPLRVEEFTVIPDSGGPGKYRGGVGLRKNIKFQADSIASTQLTDKEKFAPWGLSGGKPGAKGLLLLYREGSEPRIIDGKEHVSLNYGDMISQNTAGGGGFGDPLERDMQAVLHDFLEGYVSVRGAREDYGVVIDPKIETVNFEETAKLRAKMKTH